jgi:hypothetical protein
MRIWCAFRRSLRDAGARVRIDAAKKGTGRVVIDHSSLKARRHFGGRAA